MKKIISFLLVLATVLSCFMLTVSADEQTASDEGRLPFEDVKDNHWFYEAVKFCYANEIIKGMNDYTFGWNGNLTRAQFLQMLATIDGADLTQYSVTKFEDVKTNHWYYGAVAWAYENNITSGVTDTKFVPNQAVTRAQIARMMSIYMESKYSVEVTDDCLNDFADADRISYWAIDGVKYVVSAGLISGMEKNGKLCVDPNGMTTRAQAAVIFRNFMLNYYYGECEHEFSEATCTESAVCGKCGLKNGLPMGHILPAYDCVTGGVCMACDATVAPSEILHNFAAATCAKARTCTLCGETRGEAKGHKWNVATCTTPKTCSVCKETIGAAYGHDYSGNSCTRCGIASPYAKVVSGIKKKGTYDKSTNCYYYEAAADYGTMGVIYDATAGDLCLFYGGEYSDGDMDATVLYLPKKGTTARFEYTYYTSSGEFLFNGFGYIDVTTFNGDFVPVFHTYDGKASDLLTARENAGFEMDLVLSDGEYLLYNLGGVFLAEFGFNYYK